MERVRQDRLLLRLARRTRGVITDSARMFALLKRTGVPVVKPQDSDSLARKLLAREAAK